MEEKDDDDGEADMEYNLVDDCLISVVLESSSFLQGLRL